MGIEKKTPGALTAHDKVEGRSEQGKTAFRKLCEGLTEKQKSDMNLGRVLNPDAKEVRRVTRDLIMKIFEFRNVDKETRKKFWLEYFGGPPPDIAEFVRRRIIQEGNIRDYGERMGLSHATLANILDTHMISFASLKKLRKANEPFPWSKKELLKRWRGLSTAYLMADEDRGLNEMAARMETLFEMRPTASRTQWVELNNPPASLQGMSQNKRRILMSEVRHGKPVPWEEVDRILVGLNCDLEERMEVASAWIAARNEAPREKVSKGKVGAQATARGPKTEVSTAETEKPVLQSQIEYPEHLKGKADLQIIASILAEMTGHDASDAATDEHLLKQRVDSALGTPGQIAVMRKKRKRGSAEPALVAPSVTNVELEVAPALQVAPSEPPTEQEPTPPAAEPTETRDEPPVEEDEVDEHEAETEERDDSDAEEPDDEDEAHRADIDESSEATSDEPDEDDDDVPEQLPDFSTVNSVWLLGEYAEHFFCEGSAGYGPNDDEAFTSIAGQIGSRAPLGINDMASALKLLVYSYGRHPDHPATGLLYDAIGRTLLESGFPTPELLTLLLSEPRFRQALIAYRDEAPESAVTDFFSQLAYLPGLERPVDYDPNVITDFDIDYENVIRPRPPEEKPKPADPFEVRRAEQRKKRSAELGALARQLARKQPIGQQDHAVRERLEALQREQELEMREEERDEDEDD